MFFVDTGFSALAALNSQPVLVSQVSSGEECPLPGSAVSVPEEENELGACLQSPRAGSSTPVQGVGSAAQICNCLALRNRQALLRHAESHVAGNERRAVPVCPEQ